MISEIYRCLQCCVGWGIDVLNMSFSYVGRNMNGIATGGFAGPTGKPPTPPAPMLLPWRTGSCLPIRRTLAEIVWAKSRVRGAQRLAGHGQADVSVVTQHLPAVGRDCHQPRRRCRLSPLHGDPASSMGSAWRRTDARNWKALSSAMAGGPRLFSPSCGNRLPALPLVRSTVPKPSQEASAFQYNPSCELQLTRKNPPHHEW